MDPNRPLPGGNSILRHTFRNMAHLLSANVLVALMGLATVTILARALGPAGLGVLAVAEAFVRLVDQLVRLEPWQALVRFGSSHLENARTVEFMRLVKYCTLFDIAGSLLAAVVAIAVLTFASSWMQFDSQQIAITQFFALSLFFNLASTPTGLLRIFDRFDIIAKISVGVAVIRLLLTLGAWMLSGSLWSFIVILFIQVMAEQLIPLFIAWYELRRRGYRDILQQDLRAVSTDNPGILRFIVNVNLNALARISTQRFDTLIVAAVLGNSSAGLYHLARRIGLAASKVARPLQQAIYPDIARIWARGEKDRFRWLVYRVNGILTVVSIIGALVVLPFVPFAVPRLFGTEFTSSIPLVELQIFAVVLFLASNTLGLALMTIGADKKMLITSLIGTALFFLSIVPLLHLTGVAGAIWSQIILYLTILTGSWWLLYRNLRPG